MPRRKSYAGDWDQLRAKLAESCFEQPFKELEVVSVTGGT